MKDGIIDPSVCPISYTLSIVGGKWKWVLMWILSTKGTQRYGEIRKLLPNITHKILIQHLKELEANGLISRKEYSQVPPKVEYSLTEKGQTLIPILELMSDWGSINLPQ
ncbi:MAG: helix-turn-helix transcriptional regulator [Clostridium beijerinckii]|jgi:DNA-binding HxlR family transcriptional regulator|uniref:DNA-binding HxlR family transcriptional regulator n=1 Tax=Clostridium beijerinckii TaxID=1520 RepID=A0AAX0AVW5_CLOBE|nr:helix-turn-helix domain-containing protein [Clostridium beijerinckii]MCI1581571.1 helix-turn-helix transcriptional regulator [Clostridium beijerinckii]MCI1585950.1 helix-turn-helix transcriptional regulator [Clostridium beijerinckii]MCI1625116.1 helix-turn-helix transcriptional regulator [Clostridium beijerinckii]NOW04841.1 DNA-binding HxlR family transcriptional regulator [Clostridium beijerinckii]NOW82908.1 DNA-binding HxlR family transcriptional regulator [Clostridium beijerinckii]